MITKLFRRMFNTEEKDLPENCSINVQAPIQLDVTPVTPKDTTKEKDFWTSATSTVFDDGYITINVTKRLITEDQNGVGSLLPSMFKVHIPTKLNSAISFARRAAHLVNSKHTELNGLFYTVIAAPVDKSVALTVSSTLKKQTRAVFIVQGATLLYRLEMFTVKDDTVSVESCTYDVSKLLSFYSNSSDSVTLY